MSAPPGHIAAAVLLPPLGAYLADGPGHAFLLTCVLTVLAFVPGMIFALYLVLRARGEPALA
ncbi:MAG TPA: YqaE/Pmp3 family membrane protein [Sphingomonas sp.]|nr:YqaE/Pmp3 family membrane protein [Sphingomonas sp.]